MKIDNIAITLLIYFAYIRNEIKENRQMCLSSINQSTLFKHGKWLSKLVFRHAE